MKADSQSEHVRAGRGRFGERRNRIRRKEESEYLRPLVAEKCERTHLSLRVGLCGENDASFSVGILFTSRKLSMTFLIPYIMSRYPLT